MAAAAIAGLAVALRGWSMPRVVLTGDAAALAAGVLP